jgi:hypothetical protein
MVTLQYDNFEPTGASDSDSALADVTLQVTDWSEGLLANDTDNNFSTHAGRQAVLIVATRDRTSKQVRHRRLVSADRRDSLVPHVNHRRVCFRKKRRPIPENITRRIHGACFAIARKAK